MQIGSKSNTYLKQIQSRAKMHEYHVAEKDYVQIEEKAQWIIISAIDIICEFAEEIIESEANIQMDWKKYMVKLRFAMRFFDSFSKSELAGGNVEYFELLGSAIYYLGGRNGSSKVLADNISDDLDLECSSIDKTLLAILRMDKEYEYEGTNELLIEIVAELKRSLNYGDQFNYKNLKKFREEVYLYGSNREVIFSDILIAVIYLKLYNSAYCLLPLYTGVEKKIWKDILNRNTLVKELWAAQKELGENDIFRGKSATIQMPTGSGKTKSIALIIESAFLMQRTTEVMIVTPFRSLCREITDELSNAFSYTENISVTAISDILQEDYIGVLERYEMPIYNIYVLTPEKLSFMIRQNDVSRYPYSYQPTLSIRSRMRIAYEERFDLYFMFDLDDIKVSRSIINASIYEFDRDVLSKIIEKINEEGNIVYFLEEIRSLVDKIPYKRLELIASVLLGLQEEFKEENSEKLFALSASDIAEYLMEDIIDRLKTEEEKYGIICSVIENVDITGLGIMTRFINRIELAYGRLAGNSEEKDKQIISLEHLKKLENIYVAKVRDIVNSGLILERNEFNKVFYLWKCFDKDGVEIYLKELFKTEVNKLKFICAMATKWSSTNGSEWSFYPQNYSEYISQDEVYNMIQGFDKSKLNQFTDIEQIKLASFVLNYNKNEMDHVDEQEVLNLISEWKTGKEE